MPKKLNQKQKPLEERVKEKANYLFIKNNGKKDLKSCIAEAIVKETNLTAQQFCSIFGTFADESMYEFGNFDKYVNKIYEKMEREGK